MNKGLSLIELAVVALIIGVLAVLSIPNLSVMVEMNKVSGARFNLQTIYNAQKRFKLNDENGSYYIVPAGLQGLAAVEAINRNLSIKIDDPHFNYTITSRDARNLSYRAVAVRVQGRCAGKELVLINENENVTKEECRGW